jgi:hypothetical protein
MFVMNGAVQLIDRDMPLCLEEEPESDLAVT